MQGSAAPSSRAATILWARTSRSRPSPRAGSPESRRRSRSLRRTSRWSHTGTSPRRPGFRSATESRLLTKHAGAASAARYGLPGLPSWALVRSGFTSASRPSGCTTSSAARRRCSSMRGRSSWGWFGMGCPLWARASSSGSTPASARYRARSARRSSPAASPRPARSSPASTAEDILGDDWRGKPDIVSKATGGHALAVAIVLLVAALGVGTALTTHRRRSLPPPTG